MPSGGPQRLSGGRGDPRPLRGLASLGEGVGEGLYNVPTTSEVLERPEGLEASTLASRGAPTATGGAAAASPSQQEGLLEVLEVLEEGLLEVLQRRSTTSPPAAGPEAEAAPGSTLEGHEEVLQVLCTHEHPEAPMRRGTRDTSVRGPSSRTSPRGPCGCLGAGR